MRIIECPICGNSCGKEFPADDTDPAFREGKGENFSLPDGTWFCSPECLDEFISSTERNLTVRTEEDIQREWFNKGLNEGLRQARALPLHLQDHEIHAACPYVNYEGGKIWFQAAKWYQEEMCKLRSL